MQTEKRTQLYLPLSLYHSIKSIAESKGQSMAQLIREALFFYTEKYQKEIKPNWEEDPLNPLVGSIDSSEDLSTSIDDSLYSQ